jgi:hypothetical protein
VARNRLATVACLLATVAASGVGCSREDRPPTELVDGSRARAPAVQLEAPTPQIRTKVSVAAPPQVPARSAGRRCLDAAREHAPSGFVVVRVGVSGSSVTFRTSGRALVACDGSDRAHTCGRAYGRVQHGRLLDPRLDLACTTASGAPLAFAWYEPSRRTAYVAVRQPGYTEVYRVAGRVPVRISSPTRISTADAIATFDVSEHDATGALVRTSTVSARVAG